jgi:HSP90 family molecular chaperone
MIWLREGVQNSRDAILKMKRNLNKNRNFSDKIRELLSAIP